MKGTYRIYENGKLIAERENLITAAGKQAIVKYLSSNSGAIARTLAVGTGTTAANVNDTRLSFEVARSAINVISPDYVNQKIIFKATLPQSSQFAIWEIGAFLSQEQDPGSRMLLSFDASSESWTNSAFQTDQNRMGADALRVSAAVSATTTASNTEIYADTTDFSDTDKFSLAYIPQDANLSSLKIRMKVDASNYFEYSIPTLTTGYKVESWMKSQMTKTGSPTWAAVTAIDLIVQAKSSGATSVDFDGFKIDRTNVSPDSAMVSRTVLGSAVVKTNASEMDIEYTLDVTV